MSSIADLEKKLATNSFHGHEKMQLYYDCFAKKAGSVIATSNKGIATSSQKLLVSMQCRFP